MTNDKNSNVAYCYHARRTFRQCKSHKINSAEF